MILRWKHRKAQLTAALFFVMSAARPAFAASTGIDAVDQGGQAMVLICAGLAGLATVALFALAVWEFFKHRSIPLAASELLGAVLCGAIATHPNESLSAVHLTAALVK